MHGQLSMTRPTWPRLFAAPWEREKKKKTKTKQNQKKTKQKKALSPHTQRLYKKVIVNTPLETLQAAPHKRSRTAGREGLSHWADMQLEMTDGWSGCHGYHHELTIVLLP